MNYFKDAIDLLKANRFDVRTTHNIETYPEDADREQHALEWKKQRRTEEKSSFPVKKKQDPRVEKQGAKLRQATNMLGISSKNPTTRTLAADSFRAKIAKQKDRTDTERPSTAANRFKFFKN